MNHESRIKQLEQRVDYLNKILKTAGLLDDFIPLALASNVLRVSPWVIKKRIKSDRQCQLDRHYKLNGNRYLINVQEWNKLIYSDAITMRQ